MGKNYYPVLFSEECNCILKEKKVSRFINDNLESCNESDEVSDEE